MYKFCKACVERRFPELFQLVKSLRVVRSFKRKFGSFQDSFEKKVFAGEEIHVLQGPFQSMRYYNEIVWSCITPKWIGSYEMELHPVVEKIVRTGYRRILDVGAAEGYYGVGFAFRCPETEVITFEIDPISRRRQRKLAELNAVSNLRVAKTCSHKLLSDVLGEKTLLFCDIEGGEYELIDPAAVEQLKQADVLVEVHPHGEMSAANVKEHLTARFSGTHEISVIATSERNAEEWQLRVPRLEEVDLELLKCAMSERRDGPQEWLWMRVAGSN
jgi:precorrin-6B methylase 2